MFRRYLKISTEDDNPASGDIETASQSETIRPLTLSAPPSYSSANEVESQDRQQRSDLEATFDEVIDEHEDHNESDRLLQPRILAYPTPSNSNSSNTMPATNDGVFSNMSAKPESERAKADEFLPPYEEVAQDATPPYWQPTIIVPGIGDVILVEGMPVGHLFIFAWNIMISATFQLAGFLLTYLLHTSHAGKNGSLAGLGVSLVQFGFYTRSRGSLDFDGDNDDNSDKDNNDNMNANIVAYFLMILGWFIIIRSVADYLRAKKMETIIATSSTQANV